VPRKKEKKKKKNMVQVLRHDMRYVRGTLFFFFCFCFFCFF
jgi:hypothetical protein